MKNEWANLNDANCRMAKIDRASVCQNTRCDLSLRSLTWVCAPCRMCRSTSAWCRCARSGGPAACPCAASWTRTRGGNTCRKIFVIMSQKYLYQKHHPRGKICIIWSKNTWWINIRYFYISLVTKIGWIKVRFHSLFHNVIHSRQGIFRALVFSSTKRNYKSSFICCLLSTKYLHIKIF